MPDILQIRGLDAFYGSFQALFATSLTVAEEEIVAVIGANGAGKSTLLRSIAGWLGSAPDQILFDGEPIGGQRAESIAMRGVVMVPEGRRIFPSLTVEENLMMGAYVRRPGSWNLERVYELFPVLGERRTTLGTRLSGGQQQMLAIGRGLMANPRVLLLDEISLGLAPIAVKELYRVIPTLREEGMAVLLVEQDVRQATATADRVYCLLRGRVSLEAKASQVGHSELIAAYFGVQET
ncbi:MAG TPA: ABC transporter ATP-binding protein [Acidimicrobiia bacterium]|nr:ABC transporter ATP-binding protein [Acidimicrobiia bacterium]